jgi:hypothetical protein
VGRRTRHGQMRLDAVLIRRGAGGVKAVTGRRLAGFRLLWDWLLRLPSRWTGADIAMGAALADAVASACRF